MKKLTMSGLMGGAVMFIVSMVASVLFSMQFQFNVMGLGGMRSATDPVMLLFFLNPFVLSFAFAFIYSKFGKQFRGGALGKGFAFGTLMWLVSGLQSAFVVFTSMDYPIGFTLNSLFGSLAYTLLGCMAIAWVYDRF